jgi:hypothetical protein
MVTVEGNSLPITVDSLREKVYVVGGWGGFNAGQVFGRHHLFDWTTNRVNLNKIVPQDNIEMVMPARDAAGDTVYLSYFDNEIASVMLPEPPPGGITTFLTDSVDGCTIIVDRITAGGQGVVVYHANAKADAPAPEIQRANPTLRTDSSIDRIRGLYQAAQQDYQTHKHLSLQHVVTLARPHYFQSQEFEIRHKVQQHRLNVGFDGGVFIIGFISGTSWEFHYQSWGYIVYDRPWFAPKRWTDEKHVKRPDKIYSSAKFYP